MGVYDRQIATALRLIAKYGQIVQWNQLSNSVADISKPWQGDIVSASYGPSVAFFTINKDNYKSLMISSEPDVAIGSTIGYMGAQSFTPSNKDIVVRGADNLRIESIDILAPNGQAVLYTIIFKK